MGRKKNNRQFALAMELGLLKDPAVEAFKRKQEQEASAEEVANLFTGRERCDCDGPDHPLGGGAFCIDGRKYASAEVFALKQANLHSPNTARRILKNKAVRILDDTLGLDFSSLAVKFIH